MNKNYDLFALGNALVDIEVEVSGADLERLQVEKGVMTLVEEERHDFLLSSLEGNIHERASGGSAANSVMALAQLGGKAFHCCKVAHDEAGTFYANDLNEAGVDNKLDQLEATSSQVAKTGKCLVMITDDADRTMNTYLGISTELSETDLDINALKNSEYLYLEGYLVSSEVAHQTALTAKQIAKESGVKIATTLSDPNMVRFFKTQIQEQLAGGVDLLFCNEEEAMEYTGESSLEDAFEALKTDSSQIAMTLGANGAWYFDGVTKHEIAPHAVKAIDTNGAGDMFAGAFMFGLTSGMSIENCGKLASFASAHLVTQFGPRLKGDALVVLQDYAKQLVG